MVTQRHVADVTARIEAAEREMVQKGAIVSTLPAAERERWIRGLPNLAKTWVDSSGAASNGCVVVLLQRHPLVGPEAGPRLGSRRPELNRSRADAGQPASAPFPAGSLPPVASLPPHHPEMVMADDVDMSAIEDGARAQAFDPVRLVLDALAAVGTVWTFGLMVLICADVIGRSFLSMPITGVAEIAAHSVVGIVFLQLGATIYARRMTRADFLIEAILNSRPALGRAIEAAFLLLGAACMVFIAWAAWPGTINAYNAREFFGVQGLFTVPTWPFRALIIVGGAAGAVAHLALFIIEIGRLRGAARA